AGDSATSVTQDIELPTSGASGTTITWSSSDSAVVGTDGTVTRPAYTESDASVTLTATISKGTESDTQTFTMRIMVLPAPPPVAGEDDDHDNEPDEQDEENEQESTGRFDLIINGEQTSVLAATRTEQQNGRPLYLIRPVDEEQFLSIVEALPENTTIRIDAGELEPMSDVSIEWSYDATRLLANKGINLVVQAPGATLQLNINAIPLPDMQEEGQDAQTAQLRIAIGMLSANDTALLDGELPGEQIGEPVRLSIAILQGGTQQSLSNWRAYGMLSLPLPEGDARELTPTMVWLGEDGTLLPLPTRSAGMRVAQAHSRLDGVFALIHHTPSFEDIEGRWSEADIADMAGRLIIRGASAEAFEPQRAITRAELTTLLIRALGMPARGSEQSFEDVNGDAWYADAIVTAAAIGLVTGGPDGSFRPDAPLTREEASVMLSRAMVVMGTDSALSEQQVGSLLSGWNDAGQIAPWAREGMAVLRAWDILRGDSVGAVRPDAELTREEMAALLRRMMQAAGWID
ncbi:S-layer homology domain-containing protein, partial [Paenibacillus sp. IB182496]